MAVCDICGVPGRGTKIASDRMRVALRKGFDPFRLGLAKLPSQFTQDPGFLETWKQTSFQQWQQTVMNDTSGWNVCDACLPKLDPFVDSRTPKRSMPDEQYQPNSKKSMNRPVIQNPLTVALMTICCTLVYLGVAIQLMRLLGFGISYHVLLIALSSVAGFLTSYRLWGCPEKCQIPDEGEGLPSEHESRSVTDCLDTGTDRERQHMRNFEPSIDSQSNNLECLQCSRMIPFGETRCSNCGWSYCGSEGMAIHEVCNDQGHAMGREYENQSVEHMRIPFSVVTEDPNVAFVITVTEHALTTIQDHFGRMKMVGSDRIMDGDLDNVLDNRDMIASIIQEKVRQCLQDGQGHSKFFMETPGSPMVSVSCWNCSLLELRARFKRELYVPYAEALPSYLRKGQEIGASCFVHIFVCFTQSGLGVTCCYADMRSGQGRVFKPDELM